MAFLVEGICGSCTVALQIPVLTDKEALQFYTGWRHNTTSMCNYSSLQIL